MSRNFVSRVTKVQSNRILVLLLVLVDYVVVVVVVMILVECDRKDAQSHLSNSAPGMMTMLLLMLMMMMRCVAAEMFVFRGLAHGQLSHVC